MRQTTCQPIFAIGIAQFCSLEIEYGYDPGYDYYDHVSSTITGRRTGTFGVGSRCATFAFPRRLRLRSPVVRKMEALSVVVDSVTKPTPGILLHATRGCAYYADTRLLRPRRLIGFGIETCC